MRLKHLELQGYKTFAARTDFAFKGGLTAIIGPNGSGKSNVADAIQWVLGEQSFGRLRAKRSEDMIFTGSNERARMGMAQASLTLDNYDGWLPLDYGEVVITRRAYRSGENEYYLNGTRVRLRDVSDLLAQSGLSKRTYTVIGQGLIDQALSLKPDERRALIEEAAGITGHQAKRETALRELDETRHNLERVQDILGEIEPRLRYLKVQARRAEERMQVQADLDTQLRIWYGFRWHRALEELYTARQHAQAAQTTVQARQEALQHLDEQDTALRERHSALRNQLGDWHRESSALHRQAEGAQRELAVGSERIRQLEARQSDLAQELEPLRERLQTQVEQVNSARATVEAGRGEMQTLAASIREAQTSLDKIEAERQRHEREINAHNRLLAQLQAESAGHERRLVEQESRGHSMGEEHERLENELAAAVNSKAELAPQVAAHQRRIAELEAAGQARADHREAVRTAIEQTESELARAGERIAGLRRQADRLHDQLELFQRLKDEGEGFSGGTRSVLRALSSERTDLTGIIGAVADQLQVPAELELAIETALGGRLQDVIVERWQDAERAIDWLKRSQGGRATFLPLETLRPSQPVKTPSGPGVVGLASDLVGSEPRLRPVVEYLLGRVVVTRDLPTARRVLDSYRERPTVVTLEGDIVRPGGSVSGGSQSARRDQGVLARERALRELPEQIEAARSKLADEEKARDGLRQRLQEQRQTQAEVDGELAALAREQQGERSALAGLQGRGSALDQQIEQRQRRLDAARREQANLADAAEQGRHRLAALATEIERIQQSVAAIQTALAGLATQELTAELMERRTAASVVAARFASHETMLQNQQRALNQLQQEIAEKETRLAALAQERADLSARIESLRAADHELLADISRFSRLIEPAEQELATLEAERQALISEMAEHRKQLQFEEQTNHTRALALQRAQDEVEHLRHEIEHDVGLVELEADDGAPSQSPLPLRPVIDRLPVVEMMPDGIEDDVRRLRGQYSRLGSVNPNAPEEYALAQERFEFLTSQSEDLNTAAATLEKVIEELDEVMQREFMVTFRAVAREFRDQFTRLFGGGTAQLKLTEPDNAMQSGIDIIARPPGKRVQALPLLSGGERSLTAAALILSILKVSPPPFCILDEVDAALDEANVDRFRAALREAAQDTQFIVITHNRGTIEAADTIYGISMGSDSTSQALSLHLEDFDGRRELVAD
ncbi:MAG: chromosome segregation protein SMC [Anaerolineae bacterium]|nr:chromosome segregation protein SMC [Anaerolineae bacterium]